ncbi:hypothetical protein C8R43DRAFT_1133311 [Mycena crocata]|nr:hypothetical protein C8R43DRAFT_1133311 [Mycena crocata]
MDLANMHAPTLSDGQVVVTLIPGNPVPMTSILHPNGALIPIPPPTAMTPAKAPAQVVPRRPRRKMATPAMHARPQPTHAKLAREDAALLARFAESRESVKHRADTSRGHVHKRQAPLSGPTSS